MKEDKKDDDDDDKEVNPEDTEIEHQEKKARLDETENDTPAVEQNGIFEPQSEPMDDDDVQEIQSAVPIIEIPDEEVKAIDSEDSVVADTVVADTDVKTTEVVAEPESEPVKEAPAVKTTPPRGGRGGGRGRGVARRGRSSR